MRIWIVAMLALGACTGTDDTGAPVDDTGVSDTDTDTDTDSDTDTDTDPDTDPDTTFDNSWTGDDNGWEAPARAADEVLYGNISEGTHFDDVSWGQTADGNRYCWGSDSTEFVGNHVWYDRTQQGPSDLYVRLTPDQGKDLSLYGAQRPEGNTDKPPEFYVSNTGECSAISGDGNPSQPEVLCLPANTGYDYSVLIGIAGAGETHAEYKLEIWYDETLTGCPP